jgi:peptidoglycan/xylan/chitin deacetylase (PgdA/CDA1 family)
MIRTRMRNSIHWCAGHVAHRLHRAFGPRSREAFAILMYHRVADRVAGVVPPTWNVSPAQLRGQLSGLLEMGYTAWPLKRLIEARRQGRPSPPRTFAVTFDDGYENNLTQALPILHELRVPATIFIATRYLDSGQPFPFDDWPAKGDARVPAESWRPLSTAQCRELIADGLVELGAHTHTHERFVGRAGEFARDLRECLAVLHERFGIENPPFALPFGAFDPAMLEAAQAAGVTCALTTQPRFVRASDSPFEWGRFNVEEHDTAAVLSAKFSGWYSAIAHCCKAAGRPIDIAAQGVRRLYRRPQPEPALCAELAGARREVP